MAKGHWNLPNPNPASPGCYTDISNHRVGINLHKACVGTLTVRSMHPPWIIDSEAYEILIRGAVRANTGGSSYHFFRGGLMSEPQKNYLPDFAHSRSLVWGIGLWVAPGLD